ncbi:MAG: relaxase domain-containing protein [Acidobacteriaceae bacterium]|nr:relaxase domain-containing protein [Acidobacteriaceae bacterium]
MLTIRAMSNAQGYSARHLEHSDYYAEGERVIGQWQGRGAALLGLSGDVLPEQFEAIRQGLDPNSGEFLRQRQSADRVAADGSTQGHARHLYDFTISAPKSISIMAQLAGDDRLARAHQKAVAEALQELESYASTRVRQAGANQDRTTGNLVLAVYHHDTSRELDPQLHTHAVAGNLTWDGTEGRWKALQATDIYERRAYLTEVYRNALAREVLSLGYTVENRRDAKGQDPGFEIQSVSNTLLEKYSQRSRQRDEAIRAFTATNGRPPTDNEVAILVRESRADKLLEISTAEVKQRQHARLSPEETHAITQLRNNALDVSPVQNHREAAAPSLLYAQEHIFERVSVARVHELLTEALRHGRGALALADTKGVLQLQESSGELFRFGSEIATQNSLQRERQMVAAINRGIASCEPLGGNRAFVTSDRLRPEQKHAVEFVLASCDRAVNMHGAAGTGKTATLQELHRGLIEAGRRVLAVAPTMSAVEELQKVGFSDASSIQRLLQDQRVQTELHGKVLIVDEAGMVSGRQMAELLQLAERQSARIVFSGDTRQIASVEAGDALRILEKESCLKSTSLSQVQRQVALDYREAIQELRRNPQRGFEKLEQIGAVHEVAWQERAKTVARAWQEAVSQSNGNGARPSVLVVCATHEEISNITETIRAERKRAGELGESAQVERLVPQNYTTAQKSSARNFREGQVLVFHRATKDVFRNEMLEVVRVDKHKIVTRNAEGVERELTSKQAKCFEVYHRQQLEIAAHDKLILTANRRESGFRATNGEAVTVAGVDEHGRIQLQDGRLLPANYQHFDYGYAVTAHRSQGKTVDAVVISADAMKKELFYVAASRGREQVTVVTSDKELLRQTVARSGERQSATELVRKIKGDEPKLKPLGALRGVQRGRAAARQMARQAAWQEQEIRNNPPVQRQEIQRDLPSQERSKERGHDYGFRR